jgi:hypothetical protein
LHSYDTMTRDSYLSLDEEVPMRLALLIGGIVLVLVGAVWIGQGTGYFPYPSSSFMIDERKWAYIGVAVLVLGGLLIASGRRGN